VRRQQRVVTSATVGAADGHGTTFDTLRYIATCRDPTHAHGAHPMRSGFQASFFALVGLHGLHVAVACWLVVMVGQICAYGSDARVRTNLFRLGLFWHLLDIVWIAIFPVVYLQENIG